MSDIAKVSAALVKAQRGFALIHDLMHAIRAGWMAWRDARYYRSGGCPDQASF